MTTSQRLKNAVILALENNNPDPSIAIVDAKVRLDIELPVLAVDVESVTAHSEALQDVERVKIAVTFRAHIGDEQPGTVDGWIDSIEAILSNEDQMKIIGSGLLRMFSFVYDGSTQDWDESIIEITFSAESLCARLT
jgi:hypothetical protein